MTPLPIVAYGQRPPQRTTRVATPAIRKVDILLRCPGASLELQERRRRTSERLIALLSATCFTERRRLYRGRPHHITNAVTLPYSTGRYRDAKNAVAVSPLTPCPYGPSDGGEGSAKAEPIMPSLLNSNRRQRKADLHQNPHLLKVPLHALPPPHHPYRDGTRREIANLDEDNRRAKLSHQPASRGPVLPTRKMYHHCHTPAEKRLPHCLFSNV